MTEFAEALQAYFLECGEEVSIQNDILTIKGDTTQYGLTNLRQRCNVAAPSTWNKLIDTHFSAIRPLMKGERPLPKTFTEIQDLLVARLVPEDYLEFSQFLLFRRDLEGTLTALCYDLPTSFANVTPSTPESFGRTEQEFFEIALANTYSKYRVKGEQVNIINGESIIAFHRENVLVASQALFLDRYPECIGKFGCLVAIPHRTEMLCYPINNSAVVQVINFLIPFISEQYRRGPDSISNKLYWYRNGKYLNLPYESKEYEVSFDPPEEFLNTLNTIILENP